MAKQVKLDVVVGTTSLKGAVRTANEASKNIAAQYLKDQAKMTQQTQRELDKRGKMYEKLFNQKQHELDKEVTAHQKAMDKIATQEIKAARDQNQRGRMIMHAGGLAANAVGANTTGYLMRMSGVAGIGTSLVGGMSPAALGSVGLALGGIAVASKVVEMGFEALSSVVSSTAGAFMGAIASIGGARGLQQNIQDAAKHESQTNAIRMMVTPEERASGKDIDDWASKMASKAEYGAYTSEQWRAGLGEYGENSGLQKSFINDPSMSAFAGKMALVGRDKNGEGNPAEVMKMMAILQSQNPNMGHEDIQKILLSGMGIGQHGSFSLSALLQNPGLLQETSALGGDPAGNYSAVFGLGSILKKRTGDLGTATTQITGLERALGRTHQQHIKGKSNLDFGTWKNGQLQNMNEAIIQAASMNPDTLAVQGSGWERTEAKEAIANIRKQAGVTSNDDSATVQQKVREAIETEQSYIVSQEQLNDMVKESIGVGEKLKATFNSINDTLSTSFKGSLDGFTKAMQPLIDFVVAHKEQFIGAIDTMGQTIMNLLPSLLHFGLAISTIGGFLIKTVGGISAAGINADLSLSVTARDQTKMALNDEYEALNFGGPLAGIRKGQKFTPQEEKQVKENIARDKSKLAEEQADVDRLDAVSKAFDNLPATVDKANRALVELTQKINESVADSNKTPPPAPNTGSTLENH